MTNFEVIPHTADIRIHTFGDSLEELFESALTGLCELIYHQFRLDEQNANFETNIEIQSVDDTMLLIDFLSEALTIMHQNKVLLPFLNIKYLNNHKIIASIKGNYVEEFHEDVKAVTYHEAQIKFNDNNIFETMIVFDI